MALTANAIRSYGRGDITEYPVLASATIYEGSAVGLSSGYARALTAGDTFVGFAGGKVVEATAANGGANVQVWRKGIVDLTITSVAVTDVGKPVYASDDGTFTLTQGSNSYIGKVEKYVTTNTASVAFEGAPAGNVANKVYGTFTFPVTNTNISDADLLTTWTPGFAGTIEKFDAVVTVVCSTASDGSTLNLEIGTTNVTGGAITLVSDNMTTKGAMVAGTAITAANVFGATDTISIEASSTTSFAEGEILLIITYSQEVRS